MIERLMTQSSYIVTSITSQSVSRAEKVKAPSMGSRSEMEKYSLSARSSGIGILNMGAF